MTQEQIIRAWKDEDYRLGLSSEELSALPAHLAGLVELSDQSLVGVAGQEEEITTIGCSIIVLTLMYCIPITAYLISKAQNCTREE